MERLAASFFERSPVTCARKIIGATFTWGGCSGRIVETEAYAAVGDEACHTFFRPGARAFVDAHPAGTAYVYLNYGVHWLFNILVKGPEGAGFVLFRALEPLSGIGEMTARRGKSKLRELCSGPGKLTRALGIDGADHGRDFLCGPDTGIFAGNPVEIVAGSRIGISRAVDFPWRFHEAGNPHVSR
ncbi:DNA-3-methyladenine glycosylase [Luteolibacter flavescens]|uniref:Putative 3-methyladenine DNA glycosylase n=1 Tax=Luteolibacter flavescens TaxID=1859460 RepID=A0ABT3FMU5_9BACT|nr:DNA-3-methyladenine glycosylase [Luteolibacter flavescens]MCW1884895.1 DNA-3-methyladenine glycosylase [Luteolibacter flavescens]